MKLRMFTRKELREESFVQTRFVGDEELNVQLKISSIVNSKALPWWGRVRWMSPVAFGLSTIWCLALSGGRVDGVEAPISLVLFFATLISSWMCTLKREEEVAYDRLRRIKDMPSFPLLADTVLAFDQLKTETTIALESRRAKMSELMENISLLWVRVHEEARLIDDPLSDIEKFHGQEARARYMLSKVDRVLLENREYQKALDAAKAEVVSGSNPIESFQSSEVDQPPQKAEIRLGT